MYFLRRKSEFKLRRIQTLLNPSPMSGTIKIAELSSFGQVAMSLDEDFKELNHLAREIERTTLNTEKGLERTKKLLMKFNECGQRVAQDVQALGRALEESRAQAENDARLAAEKAMKLQERQSEAESLLNRFDAIGAQARELIAQLPALKAAADEEADKSLLQQKLGEVDESLSLLIEETKKIRTDAKTAQLFELEKNADSLAQRLDASRQKLMQAISFH